MPIYEFHCDKCSALFELKRPISDFSTRAACPQCGGEGRQLPSLFASSDSSALRVPAGSPFRAQQATKMAEDRADDRVGGDEPWTAERMASALGHVDIFRRLTPTQLQDVAALAEVVSIPQGRIIARQGERGESLFVLSEGKVELTAPMDKGEITLRVAFPGECLPLACLLGDGRLVTSARAMSDVQALRLPRAALSGLCEARPDIAAPLYQAIAQIAMDRYRKTVARLSDALAQALTKAGFWANV